MRLNGTHRRKKKVYEWLKYAFFFVASDLATLSPSLPSSLSFYLYLFIPTRGTLPVVDSSFVEVSVLVHQEAKRRKVPILYVAKETVVADTRTGVVAAGGKIKMYVV